MSRPEERTVEGSAKSSGQYANLDILRAFAVMAVFLDHMLWTNGITNVGPFTVMDLGHAGVLAFFVHTSCVLMFSAERLKLRGGRLFGSFVLRRLFRIYPLSIVTVLLVTLFGVPAYPNAAAVWVWPGWLSMVSSLLLVQNITLARQVSGPLWSLPYEVQMYFVLPLLYGLVRRKSSRAWIIIGCTCSSILLIFWLTQDPAARRVSLLQFAPCFLFGILCWSRMRTAAPRFGGGWWSALVLVLFAGYCATRQLMRYGAEEAWPYLPMLEWWAFCALLALTYTLFNECNLQVLNKSAHFVAKYSYGIYISHIPVFWLCFVKLRWIPTPLQWVLMILLAVAVPILAFHAIERPLINLGRKLADAWFPSDAEQTPRLESGNLSELGYQATLNR